MPAFAGSSGFSNASQRRSQYSNNNFGGGAKPPMMPPHMQTTYHNSGANDNGFGSSGGPPTGTSQGGGSNYRKAFKPNFSGGASQGGPQFSTLNSEQAAQQRANNSFYENPIVNR